MLCPFCFMPLQAVQQIKALVHLSRKLFSLAGSFAASERSSPEWGPFMCLTQNAVASALPGLHFGATHTAGPHYTAKYNVQDGLLRQEISKTWKHHLDL